jgi:putative peptidoglycan lipid II flippase
VTEIDIDGIPASPSGEPRRLAGATVGMAIGTLLSRITGVGRVIALSAALGGGGFADAYNLANTTPNIITDIVVGGVLSATFVPVFVSRLTTRRREDAWEAISAVVTVTVVVLVAATVIFFVLTPAIVDLYTVTNHRADVHQQQQVAVFLLRWFVPQLTCYGLIALFTALLNTRGKFAMPMFVPIANNLVVIAVLAWFHAIVPHPSLASIDANHRGLVLLGLGTTLGVVVQAALLIPSLLRADLHLRILWAPAHEAMRTISRLAGWTFGIVLSNQVALFVVLALADGAKVPGAVSAYTYAYTFFLLPYGVIAVSIMTAVSPSLAARWAQADLPAFRHRMAFGLRAMLAIIIPSAVGLLILAHPLIDLILLHGAQTPAQADATGAALAMFALGLPGFCTFLYMVRIFQSMQDTRTAFRIYLVENAINILFGVALVGPLGVRGLALSVSIAYTVAAFLALSVVRNRVGGLGGDDLTVPLRRVLIASGAMALVTVLVVNVSGTSSGFGLFARVVLAILAGGTAYVGTAALVGARDAVRRRRPRSGPPPAGPMSPEPPEDGAPPSVPPPAPGPVARKVEGAPSAAFRGRLDGQADTPPVRLLGPAREGPRDEEGEEESHGEDPGRHR